MSDEIILIDTTMTTFQQYQQVSEHARKWADESLILAFECFAMDGILVDSLLNNHATRSQSPLLGAGSMCNTCASKL